MTYMKKSKHYLKKSFKIDKDFLLAGLYDILFYGVVFAIYAYLMLKVLSPNWGLFEEAQRLSIQATQDANGMDLDRTKMVFDALLAMRNQVILSFGILVVLFFYIKSLVWAKLSKKKFTVKYLMSFIAINFLILVCLIFMWVLFGAALKQEAFILFIPIILLPLFFHLTTIMNSLLAMGSIKDSFTKLKKIGFSNIHYFLFAHFIMLCALVGMIIVDFTIFDNMMYFPVGLRRILIVVVLVMFVLFMTWTKHYVLRIVKEIKKG